METMMVNNSNEHYYAMKLQYNQNSKLKLRPRERYWITHLYEVNSHVIRQLECTTSWLLWSEMLPQRLKDIEGTRRTNTKTRRIAWNQKYCQWYITLTDCVATLSDKYPIDYLSIGQWSTIDNKEWWGSYHKLDTEKCRLFNYVTIGIG